jgi:hypothetical protein
MEQSGHAEESLLIVPAWMTGRHWHLPKALDGV